MHILILEDDRKLLHLFSRVLEKAGHVVSKATSIAEARALFMRESFDAFVCDMRLEDGTGVELLSEVRPLLVQSRTRVIVVSAEEQYLQWCLENGYHTFLAKPIMPGALVGVVEQVAALSA